MNLKNRPKKRRVRLLALVGVCVLVLMLVNVFRVICGSESGSKKSELRQDGYSVYENEDEKYFCIMTNLDEQQRIAASVKVTDLKNKNNVCEADYFPEQSSYGILLEDGTYQIEVSCQGMETASCYVKTNENSMYSLYIAMKAENDDTPLDDIRDTVNQIFYEMLEQ